MSTTEPSSLTLGEVLDWAERTPVVGVEFRRDGLLAWKLAGVIEVERDGVCGPELVYWPATVELPDDDEDGLVVEPVPNGYRLTWGTRGQLEMTIASPTA